MTPADIDARLSSHLDAAEHQLKLDLRSIVAEAAFKHQLGSGRLVLVKAAAIGKALDTLVQEGLSDVAAIEQRGLDPALLYEKLSTLLVQLKLRGALLLEPKQDRLQGSARAVVETELERLLTNARVAVSHHQQGFGRSVSSRDAISVVGAQQVIVQSNSPGASATINVDAAAVAKALADVEGSIPWDELEKEVIADIRGEIATIKAQLGKSKPGALVIRESGRTLRSLIENMAASAAYPAVVVAIKALWTAAGLS